MNRRRRPILIAAILSAITLAAAFFGLLRWAARPLNALGATWRAELIGAGREEEALVRWRELAVRLNAENVELRRRLREFHEIADHLAQPGDDRPAALRRAQEMVLLRARVLSRSERQARRFLEIDAGVVDGVHRGMAVAEGWSLLGVVVGEQAGTSLVQLVTDAQSRVPAALLTVDEDGQPGEPVALGVCAGTGRSDSLELRFIEEREGLSVHPGMEVVTAAGREAVPSGLVLGLVETAAVQAHSDHWAITVRPLRNADILGSVLVLQGTDLLATP